MKSSPQDLVVQSPPSGWKAVAPIPRQVKAKTVKNGKRRFPAWHSGFRVVPSLLSIPSRMESKFHTLVGVIVEAMILTAALLSTMFLIPFLVGLHL